MRASSILFVYLLAVTAGAQQTDAQRQLALRRSEVSLREAKSALQQKQTLFSEGLLSRSELDRAEAEYVRAEIDAEMNRISLTNELPSFRVMSAIKSVSDDGAIIVALTLEELDQAYVENISRNYFISLAEEGTIIAEPYQRRITVGARGRIRTLRFRLLRDVNRIVVVILSGTRREEIGLLLQRDANDLVRLSCEDCSQEGLLGGRVEYRLSLERFDRRSRALRFNITGLPRAYSANILDSDTRASLTAIQFADTAATKKLFLEVVLPEAVSLAAAEAIPFVVSVKDERQGGTVASVALQLRPKGTPRLTLSSDNLLLGGTRGSSEQTIIVVRNAGTAEATDVVLDFDSPADIELILQPQNVPSIPPQGQARIQVSARISDRAVPGDYSVPIKARTRSMRLSVVSPELALRVAVSRGLTATRGASVTAIALLLIIASVVIFRRFLRS